MIYYTPIIQKRLAITRNSIGSCCICQMPTTNAEVMEFNSDRYGLALGMEYEGSRIVCYRACDIHSDEFEKEIRQILLRLIKGEKV